MLRGKLERADASSPRSNCFGDALIPRPSPVREHRLTQGQIFRSHASPLIRFLDEQTRLE
jgi:hypothetical protein